MVHGDPDPKVFSMAGGAYRDPDPKVFSIAGGAYGSGSYSFLDCWWCIGILILKFYQWLVVHRDPNPKVLAGGA